MSEYLFLYTDPAVHDCRKCLLTDACGALPKRISEVVEDLNNGEVDQLQCDDCQLGQVDFDHFVTALCLGALLGDEMGDV